MRVLVACEFSGVVREAFRRRGHDAWSCDLLPAEDGSQYHIQGDCSSLLADEFDLLIAHPPCTYLTVAGNKWFKPEYSHKFPDRHEKLMDAIDFFMLFTRTNAKRVCIENPIGRMSSVYRKPDQIVQPYQFGHPDRKPTCLWLFGLPPLEKTNVVAPNIKRNRNGKTASVHHDEALRLPPDERWKVRSRTYQGIADAMAAQWGNA